MGASQSLAQTEIDSHKVTIFSATYCSYCNVVKRAFNEIGCQNYKSIELNRHENGQRMAEELEAITKENTVSTFYYHVSFHEGNMNKCFISIT